MTTITDANVELGHIVVSLHLVSGVSKGRRMKSIITDGDISGYLVVRRSVPGPVQSVYHGSDLHEIASSHKCFIPPPNKVGVTKTTVEERRSHVNTAP